MRALPLLLACLSATPVAFALDLSTVAPRWIAADDACRVTIAVAPDRRYDPSSPLEMEILVEGLGYDPNDDDPFQCGPYTGGLYCQPVLGSKEEGYSCRFDHWTFAFASVGGFDDAAELAPGVYASSLVYMGYEMDALATLAPR